MLMCSSTLEDCFTCPKGCGSLVISTHELFLLDLAAFANTAMAMLAGGTGAYDRDDPVAPNCISTFGLEGSVS